MLPRDPAARRLLEGVAVGVALVLASAIAVIFLEQSLGVRSPSMTFLCSVILAATWYGRHVALITALAAFGVYNFYLAEPRFTLGLAGPDDILTLLVFVGVALVIGTLAGRLHDQEARAREQAETFQTLFAVSRSMAERGRLEEALSDLARGACKLGAVETVVFLRTSDSCVEAARHPNSAEIPATVRSAASRSDAPEFTDVDGWRLTSASEAGSGMRIVLAWRSENRTPGRDLALGLLVDLAQTSTARRLAIQQRVEIEALAAADKLRSALMASMSHDFRTPLATIMASASSLRAQGRQFSGQTKDDLLASIQEEAERLTRYVANIFDMTRLDANALHVQSDWIDAAEVIEAASLRVSERLGRRRLEVLSPAVVPSIKADRILLEQALTNVLENAIKHTPPDATIRIGCECAADTVTLWVEDNGPGAPAAEHARIFDKFYRIDNPSNAAHGAGLGLAISKGFVEAMGGVVAARSSCGSQTGLRVEFAFPRLEPAYT